MAALQNMNFFSTIDLKNAYHQIKMNPESVKYTAFTTPMGIFEYVMCPYGLKNGPSVFQRIIFNLFSDLIRQKKVSVYIDDIVIPSKELNEHLETLGEVFRRLRDANLEIRKDKCHFLQTQIVYLGYKINKNELRPTDDGIKAIKEFPVPNTVRKAQSFVGLAGYFRKFIGGFSVIAKSLYDTIKCGAGDFKFGAEQLEAFETLKHKLISAPVLAIYNPTYDTELHTDASKWGFGAILMQRQEVDGKFHPVFFFSKRSDTYEEKLHSFELETLAVVHALKRFRVYVHGLKFKIITDCEALINTLKRKETSPKIHRWALFLQDYDYKLEHRKGESMPHVDSLSRNFDINIIAENTLEEKLAVAQGKDEKLKRLMETLEKKEDPFFEMRNGLIYRKTKSDVLFVVPDTMINSVLKACHDDFGHLGVEKTYEYLSRAYWFKDAKEQVKGFIENCFKCIVHSPDKGRKQGRLHNIPEMDEPFDTVHIDHCGPFEISGKNRYLFAIIEGFTKFVKFYSTQKTDSAGAIRGLKDYCRHYSRPRRIVSDRASCFTSEEFALFVRSENIEHELVATGSHQANGQIERVFRTFTPMCAKLKDEDAWHTTLKDIEYVMNNSLHRSLGSSPAKVLFGIEQRGRFVDGIRDLWVSSEGRDLKEIRKKADQNIRKDQQYNKMYFDKKHSKPTEFEEGEYVMIRNNDNAVGMAKRRCRR